MRPRRAYALVTPALGAAGGLLALLLLGHLVGFRAPLSPGHVSGGHMIYDDRCEECHVPLVGAADVRCQRCHDPSSAGRLTNGAHVFFGSLDAARAAAAPAVACARCHVEHGGTGSALTPVDEDHCTGCHSDDRQFEVAFARFEDHVEFDVLAAGERQATGIRFSHLTHVTGEGGKQGYLIRDRKLGAPPDTCGECHRLDPEGDDFAPLSFEAHCADCHAGDLKMDPVPVAQVSTAADLELAIPREILRDWDLGEQDFDLYEGELTKLAVRHADPWVQHNIRRLWRELDPAGFAEERARIQARKSRLERRLALASPTALQGEEGLAQRAATLESEIAYLDSRLTAQQGPSQPTEGLARLDDALAAARAAGDAETRKALEELVRRGAALRAQGIPAAPLPRAAFDRQREELLEVLAAIESADPARRTQVDELRRRLEQLSPGETARSLLSRARQQRVDTLRRVQDEVALRESGTAPPSETLLGAERQMIAAALRDVNRELALRDAVPDGDGPLTPAAIERKQQALLALARGCRYCHELSPVGELAPTAAAESVLWRARFTHRDHLTQGETCASCHSGDRPDAPWSIETSRESAELNFRGVESCRACHRSGQVSQECQKCHDYHPPAKP